MGSGSTSFIPLEVRDPISKPAVPYIGEIPGSVKQDMAIVFQGTVPVDATSFEINFMTGPTENDDIAFQYNPRIGDCTALNSKRNGSWETQESACHNPFTRGGAFIILAVINSEGYQVYVNGIKHCTFTHRLPLEKVSNINIRGNISLLVWGLIDSWSTTASSTELKKITSTWTSTSISTTSPFEISNPVSKPALPYVGTIQGGLKPDMAIFLQGTVPADGKKFEINFKTGPTEADDIAFHFNPRFGNCTALNSKRNGSWETQQNESDKPFTKGGSFQIFIAVKPDAYDVYVNGSKHCTFKHRLPLEKVSTLNFKGDVSLFIYGLIQKWTSPFVSIKEKKTLLMGSGSTSFIPLQVRDPISKPAVPYIGEIPGSVKQDMAIVFQGTVPVDATSFEINFMTGPTENDDIAFQYNPRIGDCTALNSKRNGTWETQESACHNPFTRGGAFIILAVINSEGYQVYVNGIKHCTFTHRLPLEKVSNINIRGNISLLVWGLIDSWSTTASSTELKKITSTWTSTSTSTTSPFEISNPVSKPALPYVGTIQGGLKPDTAIFLQGTVPADGKNFEINFKTGPTEADDIAFHYKPIFGNCTALNSKKNGSWETQQNESDKPFTKGGSFQIFIAVKPDAYDVYVNGSKHCTFKHRLPLEKVSTLNFSGDVSLSIYGLIQKWTSPFVSIKEKKTLLMGSGSTSFIPLEVRDPISKPAVPYIGEIPGSVKQDMAIVFQGTVPVDATSFEINFMTGPTENDDIAFQYNPRIGDCTALNSKRNGSWETQESACHNPFTRGGAFIILTVINSEGYQVYVNGIKHCTFTHRLPLEKVSNINIRGNISLLVWGLIDSWSTTASSSELKKITSTWTSTSISTTSPFEISNPVSKPALPYVGTIHGGLKPDTAIFLQGTVPADGKKFEINFKTGPTEADDIAFHFNPRFGNCTALNSKRNGSWETQQNESDKPFTKGGSFQIFIAVKPDAYDVYVNGSKHCTFKHRLPLEKVSTLNFKGDVSLFIYGLIQKWTSPFVSIKEKKTLLMGSGSTSFIPLEVRDPISKPAVPYIGEIPGSVKQDMAIVFQGTVPVDATSFEINFMTGPTENDDIAFHYNPRIGDCTALNSKRNGTWETQESACHNPFTRGGAFIILAVINSEGYQVYVNGIKHCTFTHRLPLEKVSNINIRGNISLLVWGLIDSWSTTASSTELKKITSTWTSTSISTTSPFEISNPVSKPALPYVGTIRGGLKPDTAIFLQGTVPADGKNFEINFKTGPTEADDIAFHYKPIFGDCTALNSKRNGSWETQQNESDKPFTKGGSFQIFIAVKPDAYDVFVNGSKHCTFTHRLPLEKVSTLHFNGDVSLFIYGLIPKWTFPSVFIKEKKSLMMESGSTTPIPLEISDPITNPALPYVGQIPGGIKQDTAVVFQGSIPVDATGFIINFQSGPSDSDDIAFHYNPRIGDCTALNSKINGSWEKPENVCHTPFTRGGAFTIIVVINPEGYEVFVNGLKHCTFKHRTPLEKVSTINIHGNVSLLVFGFINRWSMTSSFTELQKITSTQISTSSSTSLPLEISNPIINPALPATCKIPGGVQHDSAVFFQGTIPADAKGFIINFKTGSSEGDDIAFQYNPRFGEFTALNSFRKGSWETQEKAPDKPFTKGSPFQIIISINSEGYEVYVNGLRHCTFNHRIPSEKVSTLDIRGDISQLICGFIQGWSTSTFFTQLQQNTVIESSTIMTESGPVEISHPLINPTLPYLDKIPGGIKQDMALFLQGSIPPDGKGFIINFKTGSAAGDDIAFHYNLQIGECTALNSFKSGKWEMQEKTSDEPFARGGVFQIIFVINSEGYEVYVNGLRHCLFKHRISLEKVSTLDISGDVLISIGGYIYNWSASAIFSEINKIQSTQSSTSTTMTLEISQPIPDPVVPYVGKIPIVVKQDKAVFFQGNVLENANEFQINFKTGQSDGDDIAFHFSPHIGKYTALNCFRNGTWEKEENASDQPFTKGAPFQIIVAFKSEGYEVYSNGMKHCTFKHRIGLENVSTIEVHGEVTLQLIGFVENWKSP
ncbi:uncharacterized protein LOC128527408 isoform X1 [Clarias gariepinus]|uniref:uncharacterized protein LOC128527408 isoform X1 n=1 Tax=Clarias gariepinus TaxID=13013 RepID=UPI00234C5EF9|nr:uncharacterized protein LOC128527408 isoform X1 [Clarias gariepinus]